MGEKKGVVSDGSVTGLGYKYSNEQYMHIINYYFTNDTCMIKIMVYEFRITIRVINIMNCQRYSIMYSD